MKNNEAKNWYKYAGAKIKEVYGAEYKLFAGLLSATSPLMGLSRNYNTAKKIYNDYIANPGGYWNWIFNNKKAFYKKYILWHSHYNNVIKVLYNHLYDNNSGLLLEGLKVNSFYQNLIGNKKAVTIDKWILRYYQHKKSFLSISDYKYISRRITLHAKKLGLAPCELQAILCIKTTGYLGLYVTIKKLRRYKMITINEAKKIIKKALADNNLPDYKLTGKVISFMDLSREKCLFIKINGWAGNPKYSILKDVARENNFHITV